MLPKKGRREIVVNGILYYYTTTLELGNHIYKIESSDGINMTSTNWINGPSIPSHDEKIITLDEMLPWLITISVGILSVIIIAFPVGMYSPAF